MRCVKMIVPLLVVLMAGCDVPVTDEIGDIDTTELSSGDTMDPGEAGNSVSDPVIPSGTALDSVDGDGSETGSGADLPEGSDDETGDETGDETAECDWDEMRECVDGVIERYDEPLEDCEIGPFDPQTSPRIVRECRAHQCEIETGAERDAAAVECVRGCIAPGLIVEAVGSFCELNARAAEARCFVAMEERRQTCEHIERIEFLRDECAAVYDAAIMDPECGDPPLDE